MQSTRRLGSFLSLGAAALLMATPGCGKDANTHPTTLLEFPSSSPHVAAPLTVEAPPAWLEGRGLAVDGDTLYAVDRDNGALVTLDRQTLTIQTTTAVGERPEQVVVGPDGAALVTVRETGEVVRLDAHQQVVARATVGTEAYGIALSTDGLTAYVTLPAVDQLVTLDAITLDELDRVDTLSVPRAVLVSPNGFLVVSHHSSDAIQFPLDGDGLVETAGAAPIALRNGNPADAMQGQRLAGLNTNRAVAATLHPETGGVLLAHVQTSPGTPEEFINAQFELRANGGDAQQSDGYGSASTGGVTFDVPFRPIEVSVTATNGAGTPNVIDADFPVQDAVTGEPITHLIDQPSDIHHHPTWTLALVTGYGTDNVLVLNTRFDDPMRSPLAVIDVGHAPKAVAYSPDGATAYVLNEHQLTISEIDLTPLFDMPVHAAATPAANTANSQAAGFGLPVAEPSGLTRPIRLSDTRAATYGDDPLPADLRRGARIFTFARSERMSHAGQFACNSCHFEGTEDKTIWFITDGPRQTPALAERLAGTAPFNWNGTKPELKGNMTQTIDRMGGTGLNAQELDDLEQFLLRGLKAPKNPHLAASGALTAKQLEGKAIFESKDAGCAGCHQGSTLTDGGLHDVGTATEEEVIVWEIQQEMGLETTATPGTLNTPTLRGLFYTAPYLHTGRAATLYDVIEQTGDQMGKTSHLTASEKDALVAYLLTL